MKIMITGGAGFVGMHLVKYLISQKYFPIIVDNLRSGKYKNIKQFIDSGKAKFIEADVRNFPQLLKLPKTETVIHLAAIASVIESIRSPLVVNDVNINGTLNILEFCRRKKIKNFVFTSSAAIFGNYEKKITDKSPTIPTTVYGATKLTGEYYCKIYSELFGIRTTILRPFNIYGLGQNDSYAGVITKFMQRIKNNKRPIIFGNGKQTRDFIHVSDVAKAFEMASSFKSKNKFNLFCLATGKSTTINQLAKICLDLSNKPNLKPIYKEAIPGVVFHNSVNTSNLRKTLKFIPKINLTNGLSELFKQ